ncbi:uncharacterized protein LOC101901736 isoform X2 [Musca domestica]|uniref:Uncharacterized protein LOC101901736 isoform X2 n=1 Tax=Musca domestica TaxID=7370 RepID=A0ABM3UYH8_MUSDO|nr:uncharacterized protein LOC101901736 isoform X2 [Musca domestica]
MTIWPFSNENTQDQKPHEQNEPPEQQAMVAPPPIPMMIGHNFPKDLEMKINTTKPYIFASLVSWPFYWLYRGLEWGRHRENVKLPAYIHRTHLQAKFLQFAIILTGITMASLESIRHMSSKKDPSLNGSQLSNASHNNNSNSKKWSFGRFFRRNKKEIESESSSEDDRKAGFSPAHKYPRSSSAATSTPNKKSKSKAAANSTAANRNSRAGGFDHIVVSPISGNSSSTVTSPVIGHIDNEFFLPVETVSPMGSQEPFYQNQTQRLHHSQQYLSHAPQTQQQLLSKSAHSLDRRASRAKQRSAAKAAGHSPQVVPGSSSEEELISLNSSTFSKYRSDESIHSGGQGHNGSGMSRKSRAARNERYYKRLSRDGEVSHGQVPVMLAQQPTQRWKTQPVPLSIYQPTSTARQHPEPQLRSSVDNASISKLRNTSSLQHMAPYVQWNPQQLQQRAQQQQPSKNLQNSVNEAKRSISYDSHIHLQNINGRMQTKPLPPPPPPRDPLRRVNVGSGHLQEGSSSDLRPISYAFDQTGVPVLPASGLSGRCVSDDKIWAQHQPQYQSIRSLNISANQGNQSGMQPQNRRFITRADRDAHPGKKSLPNGLDFHYVADATPRSRKPIHMLEAGNKTAPYGDEGEEQPPSSGILRTTKSGLPTSPTKVNATEFWKRMDGSSQNLVTPTPAPRGRDVQRSSVDSAAGINMKPRSVSSSRLSEMRAYPMPMYSEVYKPNKTKTSPQPRAASPHPHQGQDEVDGVVCGSLRIKPAQDNSSSNYVEIRNKDMPKSHSMPDHYHRRSGELSVAPNKYEEYVNERREQHQNAPQPPQRKLVGVPNIPQLSFPRKKPANLEEAINELEAIYRSLGLTEPEATETVPGPITKKDRVPTPNDFEKYALAHADEYDDDDDSPTGEPDPIRDDVAYRNIKLANLQHKTVEKQPPFGIPIGPIVPASQTDYLHVKPNNQVEFLKKDTKAPDVIKDDLAVRALRKDPLQPKERFQYPSSVLPKKNRATRTQSANIYALIQRDAAKPSGGDLYSYMELTKSIDRSGSMSDLHKKGQEADDIPSTLKLLQSLKEQENEQNTVAVCSKKSHIPFRHPSQGGAICQLPQKLSTGAEENKTLVVQHQKPTPMPRKSLTPEPQQGETNKMEEALNKIAQDAQESSIKLSQELQELRKEALITQSKPKRQDSHDDKFEQDLQEIEKVSQAAKKCGKLLLETLPDSVEVAPNEKAPRKLHKEDKLIQAIDQVSEAANKVCEKILKDIVTTEPPVVVQEAVQVKQTQQQQPPSPAVNPSKKDTTSSLVIPTLIKKLDPIQSDKIEAIARRCMRQLSDLADNHDYDNLNQPEISVASTCNLEASNSNKVQSPNDLSTSTLTETPKAFVASKPQEPMIEDIDQIMRECEDQARKQEMAKTTSTTTASATTRAASSSHGPLTKVPPPPAGYSATASSISSSSDCLAKSSSPTASRRFSSSITSFNPYSSSDYIKSPSSEYHAPSTDRIKSCSTTSYDVQSTTSATPNITTTNSMASNFSCSPSPPPLNLTPVSNCSATLACSSSQRARSSSPSQYNSSEELAMIFGIEDKSGANRMPRTSKLQKHSGNSPKETPCVPEPLTAADAAAASPLDHVVCTANECRCSSTSSSTNPTNPNECCLLTLNNRSSNSPTSTTNTNASSPSASAASSASSMSRLETIPEQNVGHFKLSPNFNRIYASRVNILVDRNTEDAKMTQCDSLSSLEETSSNPDSGNVSLADFPLSGHTVSSNSLQLSSSFNSRFEIRNCFKTEIAIKTEGEDEEEEEEEETEGEEDNREGIIEREVVRDRELSVSEDEEPEFPRLPTEEELLESLRESQLEYESSNSEMEEFECVREDTLFGHRASMQLFEERMQLASAEIMAEVKALQARKNFEEANKMFEQELLEIEENVDLEEQEALNETLCETDSVANDKGEVSTMSDTVKESLVETSPSKTPRRKRSIIMETPQLEMNIMEEKINYEISIKNDTESLESRECFEEIVKNCCDLEKALIEDTQLNYELIVHEVPSLQDLAHNCYEKAQQGLHFEENENVEENGEKVTPEHMQSFEQILQPKHGDGNSLSPTPENIQLCEQRLQPHQGGDDDVLPSTPEHMQSFEQRLQSRHGDADGVLPSTSTQLQKQTQMNILGEQRANAVNGLTLLEHIVVACTLGLINTDDLFTLFLIIIGIIIVIAIALF